MRLNELSYKRNIGAMETFKFFTLATAEQKAELKRLIAAKKYKQGWDLVQDVIGVKLPGLGSTAGVAENRENYGGINILLQKDDDDGEVFVKASAGSRELGHVLFTIDYDSQGMVLNPQDLEVDERFRGQGIAATMYDYVKSKGYRIRRSGQQTDAGAAFWDKHKPGKNIWEQGVAENFADGKVKGKSRPGRVKAAGASCAGSVTDLRAKAKKYSGEKGKMYHWCANMKGGKKKANEDSVEDLEKDLKDPHSYDAIDHMMQTVAKNHKITPSKLHDRFIEKNKVSPDDWAKKQGVAESVEQVAISVRKGRNKFATEMTVNGKPAGGYQYDANSGRSIAEVNPEYKGKGYGKILVLHAIYTAAKLGMDFIEDESRTAEYDNVLDSLDSNGYAINDDGYWYVTSEGEQFLKQSLPLGEGWKDTLGNLAIAGAIGAGGAGGMAAKDAFNKWSSSSTAPVATAPAPQQPAKQIQAPVAKSSIAQGVQKAQTAKQAQPKAPAQIKNITNSPLENVLKSVAQRAGLAGTELAAFMAQCAHETLDFKRLKEIGGKLDFRKYDPKHAPKKARALGNKFAGDGERYKGRGFIQLTGRHNYKVAGQALGLPLEQRPELVEDPAVAAQVAVWYWKHRVQPNVDNYNDVAAVTRMINPGMRGLQDRAENFKDYTSRT